MKCISCVQRTSAAFISQEIIFLQAISIYLADVGHNIYYQALCPGHYLLFEKDEVNKNIYDIVEGYIAEYTQEMGCYYFPP